MIDERRVSEYCYEDPALIENYEKAMNDKTQTWVCHHRVGAIMNCGKKELIAQGCYTDRPAHDLIFLTKSEHSSLHNAGKNNPFFGKKHSKDARAKMSLVMRSGENNSMFGKHHSEETREKMREAQSGEKNHFFGKHHSEETRDKMSVKMIGKYLGSHWFNNGTENKHCKECPGPEWKRGRLRNKRS